MLHPQAQVRWPHIDWLIFQHTLNTLTSHNLILIQWSQLLTRPRKCRQKALTLVPKGPTGAAMSNLFFPCTEKQTNPTIFFYQQITCYKKWSGGKSGETWSSASISSRSSPVAIGITSSTLVLVPAASEEKRSLAALPSNRGYRLKLLRNGKGRYQEWRRRGAPASGRGQARRRRRPPGIGGQGRSGGSGGGGRWRASTWRPAETATARARVDGREGERLPRKGSGQLVFFSRPIDIRYMGPTWV